MTRVLVVLFQFGRLVFSMGFIQILSRFIKLEESLLIDKK